MEYSCNVMLHRNENKPASTTGNEMGESHRCHSEQKYLTQKYVWQGSMYVKFKTRLSPEARAASSYLSEVRTCGVLVVFSSLSYMGVLSL